MGLNKAAADDLGTLIVPKCVTDFEQVSVALDKKSP
jgi:hypothetical protein